MASLSQVSIVSMYVTGLRITCFLCERMLQNWFLVFVASKVATYLQEGSSRGLRWKGTNNESENKVLVLCSVVTYNTVDNNSME